MFGVFVFARPEDGFSGMGEITAGEIGRGVVFVPDNVIKNFITQLLEGKADGINDMARSAHPDCAIGLEKALAL